MKNIPLDPQFLMNVFETMRDGLMIMNPDGDIIYFNEAAEKITEYNRDEIYGKPCTVLDTDTCVMMTESGRKKCCALFTEGAVHDKRCRIRTKSGRTVYLLKNAVVLHNEKNEVIGAVENITAIITGLWGCWVIAQSCICFSTRSEMPQPLMRQFSSAVRVEQARS
jgi:PAS domain S-box-containing protein